MDRAAFTRNTLRDFVSHLGLGIADDDVIIRNQEGVGNLTLGAEGFAGTGGSQNQAVGVLELLPVHHDEVLGQGVQAVVEGFFPDWNSSWVVNGMKMAVELVVRPR